MRWAPNHIEDILRALWEHAVLVFVSVGIALAISLVLGIWTARRPRAYAAVLFLTGTLFVIPSLALFALLIPVLGLGFKPAVTGLIAYSLLILTRNIATGLRAVPAEVSDAALGVGYGPFRRLIEVELPLAMPFIVAGLRIATVTVIGIATVAAYINAGGLGAIIFQGIDQRYPEKILIGGGLTALLAIGSDFALSRVERGLRGADGLMLWDALRWIGAHPAEFSKALGDHLLMSAVSLGIGLAIALPLAVLLLPSRVGAGLAVGTVNALRTIPSIAILAAALPLLGIGFLPSVVALVVLALPPILINALVGLREVEADIVDAARGMGMTAGEILWRVRLPLAAPAIFGGVRTAAVQVISGATLASFIGGGGLGDFITAGIAIMDLPRLLVGAVPIALLAIGVELGLGWTERALFAERAAAVEPALDHA